MPAPSGKMKMVNNIKFWSFNIIMCMKFRYAIRKVNWSNWPRYIKTFGGICFWCSDSGASRDYLQKEISLSLCLSLAQQRHSYQPEIKFLWQRSDAMAKLLTPGFVLRLADFLSSVRAIYCFIQKAICSAIWDHMIYFRYPVNTIKLAIFPHCVAISERLN